jgi:integrase
MPQGAEIVERKGQRFATWTDSRGRHRARLSTDGKVIVIELPGYEIQYFDENGKRRKESLARCGDRDTAKQIAAEREKAVLLRQKGIVDVGQERLAHQTRRPLVEHQADYQRFLTDKGNTSKYVTETMSSIARLVELCGATMAADLTGPAVMKAIGQVREGGKSLRTCNSYLTAIKGFSRWLWRHKRCADDPLGTLERYNEETDPRHMRRELTPEEMLRLIATAEQRTEPNHNLRGPDRAMCYRLALGTGFRAKELRSLTPESFELDCDPPAVIVAAAYSKHRRKDRQPIRRDLADLLRPWLADKPKGERVIGRLPGGTARMLRGDLKAARQAWLDEAQTAEERTAREESDILRFKNSASEVADFHSTRHTYISGIVAGRPSIKTAQALARHTDPKLTIARYAHTRQEDLQSAVDALPDTAPAWPTTTPEPEVLTNGTDGAGAETGAVERREGAELGESWRKIGVLDNQQVGVTSDAVDKPQVLSLTRNKKSRRAFATPGRKAEGKGFEPDGDCAVTADGDCPCDFCQGWRAALALQNDGSEWRHVASFDSDLQRVVLAWDAIPAAIRCAIIALVGTK